MNERIKIAANLGTLLSAFTGEHVGEPRLLICLYGPELLHVDLKFVSINDIAHRVKDPVILWERGNCVSEALKVIIQIYLELREYFVTEDFEKRIEAEKCSVNYLSKINYDNK